MATVIPNKKQVKYDINKYTFKVLSMVKSHKEETSVRKQRSQENQMNKESQIDSSALDVSSKNSFIESLMKKTEEMSSNFIKLQMKLENITQEHEKELKKLKEEFFNKGLQAGKEQVQEREKESISNSIKQFAASVITLEQSSKDYKKALENIKGELINIAMDISKEVINVELQDNSAKIAEVLSKELIKELQSASKITLKVNPKNHGDISKSVGSLENVNIVSDSAVSEGGVIAISDVGSIDAQIFKRFERVKRATLSE